jgi:O-methyltransferase
VQRSDLYHDYVELLKLSLLDLLSPTTTRIAKVSGERMAHTRQLESLPGGAAALTYLRREVRRVMPTWVARRTRPRKVETVPEAERTKRIVGGDFPANAMTMMGYERLTNLQHCVEDVLRKGVPGDLIEAGVWRGGGTIFMRALLKAHGVTDRVVWAADSFAGLPAPDLEQYPADIGSPLHEWDFLAVPLADVKRNFERYGLLDEGVRFAPGWFRDTLPSLSVECWSVIRLDGDLYESTYGALEHLYPRLSSGGYVIIDDYGEIPASRQATNDYRERHGITETIQSIDGAGVYWCRDREAHHPERFSGNSASGVQSTPIEAGSEAGALP